MKKNDLTRLLIVTFLIICLCPLYSSLSHGGTITDNFDGAALNDRLWWNYSTDQHQRCVQQGDELRIQIDGASVGEGWFNAGIISKFKLKGNFEIVVDYKLTNWPYSNGVRSIIMYQNKELSQNGLIARSSFGADEPPTSKENYVTDLFDGDFQDHAQIATSDTQGKMKLTRVGKIMTGYFWQNNSWQNVGSHDYSYTGLDDWLAIGLNSHSSWACLNPSGQLVHPFAGLDVETVFDNLQITFDQIKYFSNYGPSAGMLLLLLD